ncbi:MAG: hypothetical protein O7G30_14460 [Proteobacteria bacterium]|nr:hypothetical protein [Pseudomonadota bacterium]
MVELPEPYAECPGQPVHAEVCAVPFRASVTPSARERAVGRGCDSAD